MNGENDLGELVRRRIAEISESEYDRQARMLAMIRRYEDLCRDASAKGGSLDELFSVPVREKIGRAKSVVADEYKAAYDIIDQEMEAQITAIAEKGADEA